MPDPYARLFALATPATCICGGTALPVTADPIDRHLWHAWVRCPDCRAEWMTEVRV